MRTALFLASLLLTPAAVAADPALDKPITLTRGDLLHLHSAIATNRAQIAFSRDPKVADVFEAIEVILADKYGRIHLNMTFKGKVVAELQKKAPAEQMRTLNGLHAEFARQFLNGVSGRSSSKNDAFDHIEMHRSSSDQILRDYLLSKTAADVVINIAFEQDGENHLYATVNAQGTQFALDAPTAR
jgi:hypothetical protein